MIRVDQLVDPLLGVLGVLPVLAEQPLEHFVGQRAAQQRFEDRVVQRLHRMPVVIAGHAVGVLEAAAEQHVREPRQQVLEIEVVEIFRAVLRCSDTSCDCAQL